MPKFNNYTVMMTLGVIKLYPMMMMMMMMSYVFDASVKYIVSIENIPHGNLLYGARLNKMIRKRKKISDHKVIRYIDCLLL